jgi:hypothetical protein
METIEIKKNLLDEMMKEEVPDLKISPKEVLSQVFNEKRDDTLVIILLFKNENFKGFTKPYNIEICDRKMFEWVECACEKFEIKSTTCDKNSSIVPLIKPLLNDKENTLVLYSDTPLLTSNTIEEALDYFRLSGMNVLKLPRGWLFKTEYIKTAESVSSVQTREFNELEFKAVNNLKDIEYFTEILKKRIFEKHYENNILISDPNSTFIGPNVMIGQGTKIESNNVIKGLTYIGKNCVLAPFNYISDSIISNNCVIKNSSIVKSKISENMVVGPFEIIENKQA